MEQISLSNYLSSSENQKELIIRLVELDRFIKYLHENRKMYIFSFDPDRITLYNRELSVQSFHDKLNYLNAYYNRTGQYTSGGVKDDIDAITDDIEEICAVGICAFNKIRITATKDMRQQFKANLVMYNSGNVIPEDIYDYYADVFINGNVDYLSNFLQKRQAEKAGKENNNKKARTYTYSTAIGRAFSDKEEAAFVSVLIIPSIMVLIYLVIIVVAMLV